MQVLDLHLVSSRMITSPESFTSNGAGARGLKGVLTDNDASPRTVDNDRGLSSICCMPGLQAQQR